jgi:hypothetical protein
MSVGTKEGCTLAMAPTSLMRWMIEGLRTWQCVITGRSAGEQPASSRADRVCSAAMSPMQWISNRNPLSLATRTMSVSEEAECSKIPR